MKNSVEEAVSYRTPLRVTEILLLPSGESFPRCPRCKVTLDRTYQRFCDRCGQCLDWRGFGKAKVIRWELMN